MADIHVPSSAAFTPADAAEFHREDRNAVMVMIGLIASIFVTGVVLYTIVCIYIVM